MVISVIFCQNRSLHLTVWELKINMQHQNNSFQPLNYMLLVLFCHSKLNERQNCKNVSILTTCCSWKHLSCVTVKCLRVVESVDYEIAQGRKNRSVIYCHATHSAVKFVPQYCSNVCRHVAKNNTAVSVTGRKAVEQQTHWRCGLQIWRFHLGNKPSLYLLCWFLPSDHQTITIFKPYCDFGSGMKKSPIPHVNANHQSTSFVLGNILEETFTFLLIVK